MSVFTILETLLIGPLKLIFEVIFTLAQKVVIHPGLAIIFLSLVMNILVLPLYRRADAMQEESRLVDLKLSKGVAHIKKTFSGDERMMILQTYYRQNHYKPTDALNGSVSLLLEIPFFMAAYQFMSGLDILQGVPLGPIRDLGAPDGLLVLGGMAINVLPFLMTFINLISSALYLKGFPLKTKIQLYAMALFFLVFLYSSPSCLVFYWTLNNLFSLIKTIFYKIKHPDKVLRVLTFLAGLFLIVFGAFIYTFVSLRRRLFFIALGIILLLPLVIKLLPKRRKAAKLPCPNRKMMLLGGLFLTILVGMFIPSTFVAASPQEFVDPNYFHNPLWYLVSCTAMAAGTFLVWMGVFYWLANPKGKVIMERLMWVLCGLMLINYMCFGTNLGNLSANLQYDDGLIFSAREQLINVAVMLGVGLIMWLIATKLPKAVTGVVLTAAIALGGMSILHVTTINKSLEGLEADINAATISKDADAFVGNRPHFNLSKDGKNVVVLMLDRAMNQHIPYLFNEKPELQKQFDGFTYYSNTISFGGFTNFGSPALLGGYEYTPVEMNRRDGELLVDKHNEALKVMPVLFMENGYDVTVFDPVYANYAWIPDLSVFDEYPEINAYITKGVFSGEEQSIQENYRNFFCFSLMKTMPVTLQPTIYGKGGYNQANVPSYQVRENTMRAMGRSRSFMDPYYALCNLPEMTWIEEGDGNNFLFMTSDLTHEPMLLQEPEYAPVNRVDNSAYYTDPEARFTLNGRTMKMTEMRQIIHYQTNMATMMQLGQWFDYMREKGVYDNTRIILVADHGNNLRQFDELHPAGNDDPHKNVELYYPLLMVKDFDSEGFVTNDEFMTNGDVPVLATNGLIENPVNPCTGKAINSDEKTAHD